MKYDMIKSTHITIRALITGLTFLILLYNPVTNGQQVKTIQDSPDTPITKSTTSKKNVLRLQEKEKSIPIDMPIYRPPNRGAPRALVGGASRGTGNGSCTLSLVAPDHIGLTVQKQPSFYWFLSGPTKDQIEFTLIDNQAIEPLLEINLGTQIEPGLHNISLADYGVDLISGKQYWWFVAQVPDPDQRSRDIVAGAAIEYIEPPEKLIKKLTQTERAKHTHIYAEAGIWYDAISSISDLINNDPDNITLRKQRASLMEQVRLQEVAEYELKSRITTENQSIK